jgi:hypothetical protein
MTLHPYLFSAAILLVAAFVLFLIGLGRVNRGYDRDM